MHTRRLMNLRIALFGCATLLALSACGGGEKGSGSTPDDVGTDVTDTGPDVGDDTGLDVGEDSGVDATPDVTEPDVPTYEPTATTVQVDLTPNRAVYGTGLGITATAAVFSERG